MRAAAALAVLLACPAALAADPATPTSADGGDPCEGLDLAGCRARAEAALSEDEMKPGARTIALLDALCNRRDAFGCYLASAADLGEERRLRLLERACDLKLAVACADLASLLEKRDRRRARAFARRARALGPPPPDRSPPRSWKGPLYCATRQTIGQVQDEFACAPDAGGCERAAREILAAMPIIGPTFELNCDPADGGTVHLSCTRREGQLACSSPLYCEALRRAARKAGTAKPAPCRNYIRRASG